MLYAILVCTFLSVLLIIIGISRSVANYIRHAGKDFGRDNFLLNMPVFGSVISYLSFRNNSNMFAELSKEYDVKLLQAGKPGGDISGADYIAASQAGAIVIFIVLTVIIQLLGGGILISLFISLFVALLGFWMVLEHLKNLVSERRRQISREFPNFMDLAIMTMEAGSSFLETVDLYAKDNKKTALAEEFNVLKSELNMGATIHEALNNLAARSPSDFVKRTVNNIVQAQELGTPLGNVLRDLSDAMRFHRTQLAERTSEELKVKIMGPIVMMMIAIFILILGPAVIEAMSAIGG